MVLLSLSKFTVNYFQATGWKEKISNGKQNNDVKAEEPLSIL